MNSLPWHRQRRRRLERLHSVDAFPPTRTLVVRRVNSTYLVVLHKVLDARFPGLHKDGRLKRQRRIDDAHLRRHAVVGVDGDDGVVLGLAQVDKPLRIRLLVDEHVAGDGRADGVSQDAT